MRVPRVEIGITTYKDISTEAVAASVYEALGTISEKLLPEYANWYEPVNIPIGNVEDWKRQWCTEAVMRSDGVAYDTQFGALWRRKHSLQGGGSAHFSTVSGRPEDSMLFLRYRWAPKVDWYALFVRLCEITSPAHGMLHVFTKEELEAPRPRADDATAVAVFDQAIGGELCFTSMIADDGNIRRPDSWDRVGRRTYRFLPQLSWANHLGSEFRDQYDLESLRSSAATFVEAGSVVAFTISEHLTDVVDDFEGFAERRCRLRAAFREGFFLIEEI